MFLDPDTNLDLDRQLATARMSFHRAGKAAEEALALWTSDLGKPRDLMVFEGYAWAQQWAAHSISQIEARKRYLSARAPQ